MSLFAYFLLALAMLQETSAIATFNGAIKSADRKYVVIAMENGESMRMFVIGKTKFVRDGKPARPSDFHEGDSVVVDAERDARMNMLAVRVEAGKSDAGKSGGKPK